MADKKQIAFKDFLQLPQKDMDKERQNRLSQIGKDMLYENSPAISYSMPSPVIPSAIPPQAMPQTNVIRNAGLQMVPQEPVSSDDDTNFLGSLIAQGVAGIGTGLMGGTPSDIQRSAGMFESMRSQEANRNRAKLLMDPKSEESKKRREVYKKLGYNVPDIFSYTDLNDPTVLQTLKGQMEQSRLAAMPRGGIGVGGVGKPKEEPKSEKKLLDEYSKHAEALQSSIDTIEAVNRLNRTRIGRYTPDFSTSTQAESGTMDRAAAGLIKVLAGPGTVSDSDAARLGGLVPNSNMNRELASETTKRQTLEGTQKALAGLRIDRDLGRINETDFKKIINQYNKYLKNPKLELNKEINQDGDIIDITEKSTQTQQNTKIVTDKQTGKRYEVDQEGNVVEEL